MDLNSIINFFSEIFFFFKSFHNLQFGASALYSNIISVEFEGKKVIDTPPSISVFFSILKLAVLMIYF
tara:strand:+ start:155 stop:358 length:204 start_codon:yes stop_codon:yes gene_type:complete